MKEIYAFYLLRTSLLSLYEIQGENEFIYFIC